MDKLLPWSARLLDKVEEVPGIFTLDFALPPGHQFHFHYGQFNMLFRQGVGEIPISIMDCRDGRLVHTIRAVGRVSQALIDLLPDDAIGVRGPYGRGWPLQECQGKDLLFITAGLGCAPVVALIKYAIRNQAHYRRIVIMQGVKHSADMLWQKQYRQWQQQGQCQVLLSVSEERLQRSSWTFGLVTDLLQQAEFDPANCASFICGPEAMMEAAIHKLSQQGVSEQMIFLSMERNFQCGVGHCGHCQIGPLYVCKDGPVFRYSQLKPWFAKRGL